MLQESESPPVDPLRDTAAEEDQNDDDNKEPHNSAWEVCSKIFLAGLILAATNLCGLFCVWLLWDVLSVINEQTFSILVLVVVASVSIGTLQQLFRSNNLNKLYRVLHGNGCFKCILAAVILYFINGITILLFVFMGYLLEDLGDLEVIENATGIVIKREDRDILYSLLCQISILCVNLATIYFLCKQTESSGRQIKAIMAVFWCSRQRKEYKEATLTLADVLQQIKKQSIPCEISCGSLLCVVLFILAGVMCLAFVVIVSYAGGIQENILVILCMPAVLLWMYVYKLLSQGKFFPVEEADGGCELVESDMSEESELV